MATTYTNTVKAGENLSTIAQNNGMTSAQFAALNPHLAGSGANSYQGLTNSVQIGTGYNLRPVTPPPAVVTTPAKPITSVADANTHINDGQFTDFNNATSVGDPSTRTSSNTYNDIYKNITTSLTANLPIKTTTPNLTATFNSLRENQGVTALETSLTDLQAQARTLQEASKARTNAEKDKPVAMNVISGRISEQEQQDNARLAEINNSIQTTTSQLQTKYNVIDNIMKYTGTDYNNSVDAYDKQFTQNMSVMNMVKGMVDTAKSDADKVSDNARANLQIIYNNLNSGSVDIANLDVVQKANITKLEVQAGLPQGFYANVVNKNPKADILSTTTRENNDYKYADVIMRDKNGVITTKTINLGKSANSTASGKETEAEKNSRAISSMGKDLQGMRSGDYVSLKDYKAGRDNWVKAGFASDNYDKNFKSYANPNDYYSLGISF